MLNDFTPMPDPRLIQARIDEIYRTVLVTGEDGASYDIKPISVTPERGEFLRDLYRSERATHSLEIGMAWGLSTLFMLVALAENGAGKRLHVVTDPFQTQRWHGAGLRSVRDVGGDAMVEFHEQRSELLLPQLICANRQFDFVFIDGDHRFDGVFVDFVLADHLLKPGGLIVFDDVWFDPVYLTCCFAESNLGYRLVAQRPDYCGQTLSEGPYRGAQICAYRKPSSQVPRDALSFVPFFEGLGQRRERRLLTTGMSAIAEGNSALARRSFLAALRIQPLRFKTYTRLLRTFLPVPFARARRKPAAGTLTEISS
jgi:predicted O-methyltransferase YrrM